MQGNCAAAPPSAAPLGLSGAALLPLLPYQCLLIADMDLLYAESPSQLWLDGLYVRYRRTARVDEFYNYLKTESKMWMTAVTLQGDGDGVDDCKTCGVWSTGQVYAEGACHSGAVLQLAPLRPFIADDTQPTGAGLAARPLRSVHWHRRHILAQPCMNAGLLPCRLHVCPL
jgi:hypothetical protein